MPLPNSEAGMKINSGQTEDKGKRIVTFKLGGETYGVDISRVQEVIHNQNVVSVPNAPSFVPGIIQVRNRVIPVVNLNERLAIGDRKEREKKRILIIETGERSFGIVVDDISRVMIIDDSMCETLPTSVVADQEKNCIKKLAKTDEGLIIILSPENILSRSELKELENMETYNLEENKHAVSAE